MKKIFLLLILIYNFAFSYTPIPLGSGVPWQDTSGGRVYFATSHAVMCDSDQWYQYANGVSNLGGYNWVGFCKGSINIERRGLNYDSQPNVGCSNNTSPIPTGDGLLTCSGDGNFEHKANPDPSGGSECNELFQGADGVAYSCNPNTNEATPIANSSGVKTDPEDGKLIPNCNSGFDWASTQSMVSTDSSTIYNEYGCYKSSGTGSGGNTDTGTTTPTTDTGSTSPTITTGVDGSKTWTMPDGTSYNLTSNGTLTTTYPNGTTSVSQVGSDYSPSSGHTTSTGGTGGSGTSNNGNTVNERGDSSTTPPTDTKPSADSCNSSNMTLQEKMLCEMNAGIKKLNSESNTSESLNNLLKSINVNENTNFTAVNSNIKETNQYLKDSKALNENELNELKNVTSQLKNLNDNITKDSTKTSTSTTDPFKPDPTTPPVENNQDKGIIDGFFGIYKDFNTNISSKVTTLNTLIDSSKNTVSQGFKTSFTSVQIMNCPQTFHVDFTSLFNRSVSMEVDFCKYTSQLKPFIYPIILITMNLGVIFFAFRFLGVLL